MFSPDQYELVDFGQGRKLERFGPHLLDRPSPAAESLQIHDPDAWSDVTARFHRTGAGQGHWSAPASLPESWHIQHGSTRFELAPNVAGHLGIFAEQATNWDWIQQQLRHSAKANPSAGPLRVLNLFAYTGGSTLAAAAAGAQVTHVDAAAGVVARARRNAQTSGLADAPIRWIVDDVRKFVRRERKRGNFYHAIILDPPSYGHGPKGLAWKIADDLKPLIDDCANIIQDHAQFLLLTWHSPDYDRAQMKRHVAHLGSTNPNQLRYTELSLTARDGRQLKCGHAIRAATGTHK